MENATIAISRLDARLSASSMASAWAKRAAWTGYARALQLQGAEIDEIDAFSWGCGLPLPSRPRRPSHTDEFGDFTEWVDGLSDLAAGAWRDRLPFTPAIERGTPKLLTALNLCHSYARRDAGISPWLALPGMIQGLGITGTVLPCLVGGAKAYRWRATLNDDILRPILRALEDAAESGLERLLAMEADRRRAVGALISEHRPGSLVRLTALAALRPVLSPQAVANALDLTIGGAGKLLARASSLGLMVEVTGRRAWRVYLLPDLAVAFGFVAPRRGRPAKAPVPDLADRPLAKALEDFDREMAELDAKLAGLTVGHRPGL